jgi:hypothetical protein
VRVEYSIDKHAHALLYVDGKLRVRTLFERPHDSLDWNGSVGSRTLPSGTYRLALGAVDLAGNHARLAPAGTVIIRYVELPRPWIRVRERARVHVRVLTPLRTIRYLLTAGKRTVAGGRSSRRLEFRAPAEPGIYTLDVQVPGHSAHAKLFVSRR